MQVTARVLFYFSSHFFPLFVFPRISAIRLSRNTPFKHTATKTPDNPAVTARVNSGGEMSE